MSLNDLWNSDVLIPIILVVFVIMLIAAFAGGKKRESRIYGENGLEPTRVVHYARIVARRTTPHPLTRAAMINTVVFEMPDGSRAELVIKNPNIYGVMIEGDCGTLRYHGTTFVSFERSFENET